MAQPPAEASGGTADEVRAYVEALGFPVGDPRRISGSFAVRLAEAFDRNGNVAASRECRIILAQIGEVPTQGPGPLDEARLRAQLRHVDALLAAAERPAV
jgi:hypothetical protein